MNLSKRALRALLLMLCASALLACSGGGGDDEEDEDELDLPEDADATGLYNGTIVLGGVTRNMTVAVAPNGEFNGLIAATAGNPNQRFLLGSGSANGNAFTASGTAFASIGGEFPAGGIVASISITSGVITEHVQLTGSYAAGGESGSFTLSYNSGLTNRGASLARLAGTYSTLPPQPAATVSVQNTGAFTFANAGGCNGTGNFTIQDPSVNVYSFTIDVTCVSTPPYTARGLTVLDDAPTGGSNNMLVMFGASALNEHRFGFAGAK